jgi:hypothetical protein
MHARTVLRPVTFIALTIVAGAAILESLTSGSAWTHAGPPLVSKKPATKPKTSREPEWLPVRELLADSIPIEFSAEEPAKQEGNVPTFKFRQQTVVCLRGIVPYKEQVDKIAEALKIDPDQKPDDMLEFLDFQIERQVASGKPESWDKVPWAAFSADESVDALMSSEDFDFDELVQLAEQSQAFTSPLMRLRNGAWDERVSHPRLKDNMLPAKGRNAKQPAGAVGNARYLLFRFFDFSVEEGCSYRYRVKLIFENPSYGAEEVPKELARGETRESRFSDPSAPVVVEKAAK